MTAQHVGDDLFELLRGELPNRQLLAVNEHLQGCEPCRLELVEASLTHALLSSVGELLAPEFEPDAWRRSGGERLRAASPPLPRRQGRLPRARSLGAPHDQAGAQLRADDEPAGSLAS